MSGYFGALLRASGLDAGASLAPGRLAQAVLAPSGLEMEAPADEEAPSQTGARVPLAHAGAAPAQPGNVTIVDLAGAPAMQAGQAGKYGPPVVPLEAPAPQAALAGPAAINPAPQSILPATATEVSTAPRVEAPVEAPGEAGTESIAHEKALPSPLQAVLQWVAADPAAAPAPVAPASAARGKAAVASPHRAEPLVERIASPAPVALEPALPAMSHAVHPAAAEPFAVPPARRDDFVDISIGTIQVRVDAPPAQTVALPQAPAVPAATPPRSALARRSLRRI
ncbi:hypothetical protein OU994_16910 [Pseudoduganella sp. SL102]|uniref:hypothetical protein n=1 Tax=Pseudoduganella sp. SL102 TaxID=2995154 RepID=UPI00248CAF95|nr:hypothetical protein [Pseudoduganella sp. SL102]WBS00005.1 hypothetical protein OU994_16910 [Pseudoduganella sp. SL102]